MGLLLMLFALAIKGKTNLRFFCEKMPITHYNDVIWNSLGSSQPLVATCIKACRQGLLVSYLIWLHDLVPALFSALLIYHSPKVFVLFICISFYISALSLFRPGNSYPSKPLLVWGKEDYIVTFRSWKLPLLLTASMPFTGTNTPRKAERVGWKSSSGRSLGSQWTLLFVFTSVELMKACMNSWNFQPLKFPDVFKLSLKNAYFTICVFPQKRRKTEWVLLEGQLRLENNSLYYGLAMSQALCSALNMLFHFVLHGKPVWFYKWGYRQRILECSRSFPNIKQLICV